MNGIVTLVNIIFMASVIGCISHTTVKPGTTDLEKTDKIMNKDGTKSRTYKIKISPKKVLKEIADNK